MNAKKRSRHDEKVGAYGYETLSELTGKSLVAVYQDASRGNVDLDDMKSVICYIARHATPEFKFNILMSMTERDLDLSVANKKRKAFLQKRSKERQKKAIERSLQKSSRKKDG